MNIENIDDDLIISKNYNGCYLLYTKKEYYLFKPVNDTYETVRIEISETPNEVDATLVNSDDGKKLSNNSGINNGLRFLALHLNLIGMDIKQQIDIIGELFYDLADVEYYVDNPDDVERFTYTADRNARFKAVDDELMIAEITRISKEITRSKKDDVIGELYNAFKIRKGVKKAQRDLGNYLNKECGVILRKNSHELYKLDVANNGYNSTDVDEIIGELTGIFGDENLFSTTDVETAVDFISERLTPEYDIVKFSNGLYSMKEHKLIQPEKPVFTLIESPYAYNPNAKPKYVKDFLYSSLEKESAEATEEYVIGVEEFIGYLFTSGNSRNILGWVTGKGGGGKSTLLNIIQAIFGNKCADLDFADIEKNTHSTSILVGNHLNIVREAKTDVVYDNKPYKILSGDDPIPINPKNQHPYMLPKEEVPKSVMVANNLPPFKKPVLSIIQRFLIIEFNKRFRNTDKMIDKLDDLIINSKEDMEWLIYNSLEAHRKMTESNKGFRLKLNDEKTMELMYKHSKPLHYLITKLIAKHDATAFSSEVEIYEHDENNGTTVFTSPYIKTTELNELIVYLSEKEGVEIPINARTGKVDGRIITKTIKSEFDLHDYHMETKNGKKIKYCSLTKKQNGTVFRYYPELIKSEYYDQILKEKIDSEKKNET